MAGNMNMLDAVAINFPLGSNTAPVIYTMTRGFAAMDAHVLCTAAGVVVDETLMLARQPAAGGGYNDMTGAIAEGNENTRAYTPTMIAAQAVYSAGDTIQASASADSNSGDVYVFGLPTTWIAG